LRELREEFEAKLHALRTELVTQRRIADVEASVD
jgi:hypothetical protein